MTEQAMTALEEAETGAGLSSRPIWESGGGIYRKSDDDDDDDDDDELKNMNFRFT